MHPGWFRAHIFGNAVLKHLKTTGDRQTTRPPCHARKYAPLRCRRPRNRFAAHRRIDVDIPVGYQLSPCIDNIQHDQVSSFGVDALTGANRLSMTTVSLSTGDSRAMLFYYQYLMVQQFRLRIPAAQVAHAIPRILTCYRHVRIFSRCISDHSIREQPQARLYGSGTLIF